MHEGSSTNLYPIKTKLVLRCLIFHKNNFPSKTELEVFNFKIEFLFKFIIQFNFTQISLNTNHLIDNPVFAGVNFT